MTDTDLAELRRKRGWTQAQLARELGTDVVTVSRWERGVSEPRPSALKRLRALGLAAGPSGDVRFSEDAATRIRKLDKALREVTELKRRVRFSG